MIRFHVTRLLATSVLVVACTAWPSQRLLHAQDPASPAAAAGTAPAGTKLTAAPTVSDVPSQVDANLQVLTQGPVHEAFGQPVLFNPGPNPVIPNQPPAPVDELPPDTKPAGNNVQWIPGYWSFEAAQQKFVWTSGIWRLIPPGLAWVPGYWTQSGTGNQWVSGYWRHNDIAIASASFGKQLESSGPGNPASGNLADSVPAASTAVPSPTSNPAVPAATGPVATPASAARTNPAVATGDDRQAFFESRVRPTLLGTCAKCHGSNKAKNNLRLDTRAGLLKGGDSGPAIVAGDPDKSLLIQAVRFTGEPKMPPNKKLDASVIADFERWVRDGAIFPDSGQSSSTGPPVAAATATGNAPASVDASVPAAGTPVAASGEAPNLGAVPGPDSAVANQAPSAVPVPVATGAAPTATDAATSPSIAPSANPQPISPAAASATGSPYVPKPPDSLESGPVGDAPTADFIWIPGTWIYRHGRFLWLAGQWSPIRRGWVWVPARYVWTPAGFIFVDGFWDFELAHRGVLFAPVSFGRGYRGWGFSFTPSVVLNTSRLTEFLFVNSPSGCYCFGDYFGPSHVQAGIFPCFAFHMSSLGYDPFFAFSSWSHHGDIGWHERLVADFRAFRDDVRLRPPTRFEDLVTRGRSEERFATLALPVSRFVGRNELSPLQFERVSRTERGEIERSLNRFREAAGRRSEFETNFSRREPSKDMNRDSRFAEDKRDSRFGDDRRKSRFGEDRGESRTVDDRMESRLGEDRRESKMREDRGESRTENDRRVGKSAEGKGESKIPEAKRKSKIEEDRGKSKIDEDRSRMKIAEERRDRTDQRASRDPSTNRTPLVVPRRPVSTAGLGQRGIREDPAQRLERLMRQASNRGCSEPAEKRNTTRRH